jgi:Tfp pilus assembly protein PilF
VKDYKKSIEFYRRALERDPTYAQPYAGLAESYGLLGFHEGNAGDNLQKARAAAAKAIELEDSLAEAHTALAMIYALYDWNWPQAESEFRRAIDLNYGYSTAHHWYGVHLAAMGRFAESHVELARAREIDPLSPIVTLNTGYPFYYQRQYREALDLYAKALDLNPEFTPAHHDRMIVFEAQGQLGEAAKEAFEVLRSSGQSSLADELKPAYRSGGYRAMLQKWLAAVENPPAGEFIAPMTPASLAVRVGNREKGLYWLRRAVEDRSPAVVYIAVDPLYDGLRSDLRFQNLLRHIGLPTK